MQQLASRRPVTAAVLAALVTLSSCGPSADVAGEPGRTGPDVRTARRPAGPAGDAGNGGITLPAGFCATVFADGVGRARHVAVRPNGDVFVAIADGGTSGGGVAGLRDTDGDGRADQSVRFGDAGGNGVAWNGEHLYFAQNDRVVRYGFKPRALSPSGGPAVVVSGLPAVTEHVTKSIAFGASTTMYINVGSASNACQVVNRGLESPGTDPCPELETRAGIWTGNPQQLGQSAAGLTRFATGLRNSVALAVHPSGSLFVVQMDRDNLSDNWPALYTADADARVPAEELIRVDAGGDYGWPYCYYDGPRARRVLAPEYGGDGAIEGRCASFALPALALPAHWAPISMAFYTGSAFPEAYRGGAFIAFHGDYFWGSRPRSDSPGYNVVFVPFGADGKPTGAYSVFADGFAGAGAVSRATAAHRPTGLAVAPDGALLIADDVGGRIWRVTYRGQ